MDGISLAPNAAQSIGDRPIPTGGVEGAVYRDIRDKALHPNIALSPEIRSLVEDDDNALFLVPNTFAGETQTYRVLVRNEDTGMVSTVLDSYYYNYKFTRDNAAYVLATENVNNGAIKSFLSNISVLKPEIIRGAITGLNMKYDRLNDPLVMDAAVALLKQSAVPFEYDYNEDAHIDVKIMSMFLNGQLETDDDIRKAKREMEAGATAAQVLEMLNE